MQAFEEDFRSFALKYRRFDLSYGFETRSDKPHIGHARDYLDPYVMRLFEKAKRKLHSS